MEIVKMSIRKQSKYWQKEYKRAKANQQLVKVIEEFLESAIAAIVAEFHKVKTPPHLVMKQANTVAQAISKVNKPIDGDNWTLHKNWFIDGFAQMAMAGNRERNANDPEKQYGFYQSLKASFSAGGWDLDQHLKPRYTETTSTIQLKFFSGNDDYGKPTYQQFTTLVEQISDVKIGAVYQSSKGENWQVIIPAENRRADQIELENIDNGRIIVLGKNIVKRMRLISE